MAGSQPGVGLRHRLLLLRLQAGKLLLVLPGGILTLALHPSQTVLQFLLAVQHLAGLDIHDGGLTADAVRLSRKRSLTRAFPARYRVAGHENPPFIG